MTTTMNAPFGAAWRNAARRAAPLLCAALLWTPQGADAQDRGSVNPEPLPPLANPDDPANPAKELFGRKADAGATLERAPSASTPRAASPAPWRCRSTARPGR